MPVTEEMKARWASQIKVIRQAQECRLIDLTDWELSFTDSIEQQLNQGKELTFKQSSALGRIYAKRS